MSTTLASQNETPPAPAGTGARKLTERAFRIRESGIIVVLVVFVAVTASVQPRFLNITNIQFILVNTTVFALLALGETMVVISRNYDLSVGSVLGLPTCPRACSAATPVSPSRWPSWPGWASAWGAGC
jgi:rhamnose transport system permease protein